MIGLCFVLNPTPAYRSSKPSSEAVVATFCISTDSAFPAEDHAQQKLSGDAALGKVDAVAPESLNDGLMI